MNLRILTKELQKEKKISSAESKEASEKPKSSLADIEVDMTIHMAPKREYPIKIKINKIEKAKPAINL